MNSFYKKYWPSRQWSEGRTFGMVFIMHCELLKETQRGKVPSNKTPALSKSMNMNIWVVDISNLPFIRGSYAGKLK